MQIDRLCWNGEYLCFDLQELGSVYRLWSQLAYCSKTEARAIFRNKRIQSCKRVEFVLHPYSCTATKSGLCAADMVTETTSTTLLLHKGGQYTADRSYACSTNVCLYAMLSKIITEVPLVQTYKTNVVLGGVLKQQRASYASMMLCCMYNSWS